MTPSNALILAGAQEPLMRLSNSRTLEVVPSSLSLHRGNLQSRSSVWCPSHLHLLYISSLGTWLRFPCSLPFPPQSCEHLLNARLCAKHQAPGRAFTIPGGPLWHSGPVFQGLCPGYFSWISLPPFNTQDTLTPPQYSRVHFVLTLYSGFSSGSAQEIICGSGVILGLTVYKQMPYPLYYLCIPLPMGVRSRSIYSFLTYHL